MVSDLSLPAVTGLRLLHGSCQMAQVLQTRQSFEKGAEMQPRAFGMHHTVLKKEDQVYIYWAYITVAHNHAFTMKYIVNVLLQYYAFTIIHTLCCLLPVQLTSLVNKSLLDLPLLHCKPRTTEASQTVYCLCLP